MSVLAAKSDEPIPGYKVKSRLGAGGYGEVWTCEAPGQLLKAIKFVYGMLDEDRAARELKALNRIKGVRHPFLLSLERIEVVDGHLLIITELADASLKDRYEHFRKAGDPGIPRNELLQHLRDAADALDYMSDQHSLQHLDVKPENLLLVGGRIKVADFGLVKDIQESTASMMGGLTPVYAPPEVFEGSPTRRSDQYSLAIVFQEMLTGVLPFPGKTAAQLAAQHLNAKPRLSSLPAGDQPVIARALSKNPSERFDSCRGLIDALELAGRAPVSLSIGGGDTPPTITQGPPNFLAATEAGPNSIAPAQATERPRTPDDMLRHLDAAEQAAATALGSVSLGRSQIAEGLSLGGPDIQPPTPCIDCPPPSSATVVTAGPTLFIGVGGTGSRVLQRLRRRIKDRNDTLLEQQIAFLLLDSDSREIMHAQHGGDGAPLTAAESLAMPLRKTQDYRNDTSRSFDWLSRRWLYNIPRSLQTEGLRPLGRLALVDHVDEVFRRVKGAIDQLQRVSGGAAKEPTPGTPLRIVVLGSISGGTGSGSLLDVAFIARQTLDELNLSGATVEAVLAHSTNRSPQAQELAAVNSFAALAELNHFERAGVGFQGDPSCGLKARSGKGLGTTYVVQLGTELSADEYHAACDRLAEFLFVDAATPAGGWLRACRGADPQQTPDETGCRVRSFGIRQIGVGHDPLIDKAATRLSRSVLERWLGQPRAVSATKSTRVLPIPTPGRTSVQDSQAAKDAQLDTIAATHAATLGFDLDRMMHLAQQLATKILDGNPDQCFRSIPLAFPVTSDGPPLDRWLSSVTELFGTRFGAEGPAKVSALQTDLDDQARAAAGPIGLAARQWIESLVDHPSARMYGAQRVAKWLQGHLKGLLERVRETRMRLNHEWFAVEQQLIATVRPDPRQKGKAAQPADVLLLQLCRLRLLELVAAGAGTLVSTLQAHLLQAQDGLTDLSRELQNLTNHYSTPDVEEPIDIEDPLASMKASVADKLRSQEEQLAAKLDDVLTTGLVTPSGGLRKLLHSAEQLNAFRQQLETIARSTILRSLEQLDLAGLVLNSSGSMSGDEFSKLLAAAQPALQACGGERRLACIVPTTSAVTDADVAKTLAAEPRVFAETPTIVRDAGSDVVLLFEIGEIPLVQVAAAFIDQRPDYLECAERIHTRADVQWQPLLRF